MALEKVWIADDAGFLRLGYSDGERVFYNVNAPFRDPTEEEMLNLLESLRRFNRNVLR